MSKAAVVTMGCKVNQFESSSLSASLKAAGYEVVEHAVGVDLVVINTCTVTQKADHEALSLIRRLSRRNPEARIVATGCLAQSNPEMLAETGLVTLVLGQNEKAELVDFLAGPGHEHNLKRLIMVAPVSGPAKDFGTPTPERTRAFYKIQDGCSAGCAYCAVPLSRGPSRSLGLETVLGGLREYMVKGLSEVVLCGIHLGHWGRDLMPPLTLSGLLHAAAAELEPDEEFFRLRLSSIEPLEVDDDIIAAYEMYPWLAPHLHLPLQSGADHILGLMGRPYRAAQFRELISRLKKRWPLMSIGVDVMVGFPGETDEDFEKTRKLLDELPISYFHVFPYSPRPGTKAADFPGQVPEPLKKARTMELKNLNQIKREKFAEQNCGKTELALIENTPHKPSGRLKVLTGNYLSALLPKNILLAAGLMVPVVLEPSANPWGLLEARPV